MDQQCLDTVLVPGIRVYITTINIINYFTEEAEKEPQWNFFKYLIDAEGQVWGAWGPNHSVQSITPHILEAVKQASRHKKPNADEL